MSRRRSPILAATNTTEHCGCRDRPASKYVGAGTTGTFDPEPGPRFGGGFLSPQVIDPRGFNLGECTHEQEHRANYHQRQSGQVGLDAEPISATPGFKRFDLVSGIRGLGIAQLPARSRPRGGENNAANEQQGA